MEKWLESVYSDGSAMFVSNPEPGLHEAVTIRIRMYEDAPVRYVFLRTVPNGEERLVSMERYDTRQGFAWYRTTFEMTEPRMQYQFYLACDQVIYYYNQRGITTYIPDQVSDFVLLADYRQPSWVKNSVFYQIFPERFCNGNPDNDVRDGEYSVNGHAVCRMKRWEDEPLPYEKGFCMDFFGGDLEGIEQKIPYLKELGVTAVYLTPIFAAPSVHKYDCIDYFHVDPHFGGDEALAKLSDALHENGMKLILDISINHTGTAHKWFNRDALFFDESVGAYRNPDSKERKYYFFEPGSNDYVAWADVKDLPTLNYTSMELRKIIYAGEDSVLRKWLKPPYNIDGWRFDVADMFARNNEIQLAQEIWPEVRRCIREENADAYILAEAWGDCAQHLQGKEWDSAMNYYGCGRVLRQFLGLPDLLLERNGILQHIPYRMTAEDVENRIMEHLAQLPFVFWQNQFNLIDSHDVSRVHNHASVNLEEYRGAVILQFMLIGAPSVYYGDEAGIGGWTQNSEGCRFPMPWQKEFKKSDNWKLYRTLCHLKQERRSLKDGGMKFLYAKGGILALARFYEEDILVAVVSVSEKEEIVRLPMGSIGAAGPKCGQDLFGKALHFEDMKDDRSIVLTVEAHTAYLIDCKSR